MSNSEDINKAPSLSPALWLWLPLAAMAIQIIMELTLSFDTLTRLNTENGPIELLQFFTVSAGAIVAIWALFKFNLKEHKLLTFWFVMAAICCFYVAGEEVSWGQHFAFWSTPEFWTQLNDQQETNLHNVSSWFDQKPRLILEIGILFGGIIIPLLQKYKPALVPTQFDFIYPPAQLWVIAALSIGGKIIVKITESFDVILFNRFSEIEELLLFYFVFLYLLWLKSKIEQGIPKGTL